ncbi:uncharacterized protein LOC126823740 [Patella vulgata]|uniref:uncharacterized protein LOC126823740 n=1 Tax=Patella vulgata TaxID=6465 RepID=UPI0024A92027|nr:uncharacterized protein LOC126823740 [Patella vulgata]
MLMVNVIEVEISGEESSFNTENSKCADPEILDRDDVSQKSNGTNSIFSPKPLSEQILADIAIPLPVFNINNNKDIKKSCVPDFPALDEDKLNNKTVIQEESILAEKHPKAFDILPSNLVSGMTAEKPSLQSDTKNADNINCNPISVDNVVDSLVEKSSGVIIENRMALSESVESTNKNTEPHKSTINHLPTAKCTDSAVPASDHLKDANDVNKEQHVEASVNECSDQVAVEAASVLMSLYSSVTHPLNKKSQNRMSVQECPPQKHSVYEDHIPEVLTAVKNIQSPENQNRYFQNMFEDNNMKIPFDKKLSIEGHPSHEFSLASIDLGEVQNCESADLIMEDAHPNTRSQLTKENVELFDKINHDNLKTKLANKITNKSKIKTLQELAFAKVPSIKVNIYKDVTQLPNVKPHTFQYTKEQSSPFQQSFEHFLSNQHGKISKSNDNKSKVVSEHSITSSDIFLENESSDDAMNSKSRTRSLSMNSSSDNIIEELEEIPVPVAPVRTQEDKRESSSEKKETLLQETSSHSFADLAPISPPIILENSSEHSTYKSPPKDVYLENKDHAVIEQRADLQKTDATLLPTDVSTQGTVKYTNHNFTETSSKKDSCLENQNHAVVDEKIEERQGKDGGLLPADSDISSGDSFQKDVYVENDDQHVQRQKEDASVLPADIKTAERNSGSTSNLVTADDVPIAVMAQYPKNSKSSNNNNVERLMDDRELLRQSYSDDINIIANGDTECDAINPTCSLDSTSEVTDPNSSCNEETSSPSSNAQPKTKLTWHQPSTNYKSCAKYYEGVPLYIMNPVPEKRLSYGMKLPVQVLIPDEMDKEYSFGKPISVFANCQADTIKANLTKNISSVSEKRITSDNPSKLVEHLLQINESDINVLNEAYSQHSGENTMQNNIPMPVFLYKSGKTSDVSISSATSLSSASSTKFIPVYCSLDLCRETTPETSCVVTSITRPIVSERESAPPALPLNKRKGNKEVEERSKSQIPENMTNKTINQTSFGVEKSNKNPVESVLVNFEEVNEASRTEVCETSKELQVTAPKPPNTDNEHIHEPELQLNLPAFSELMETVSETFEAAPQKIQNVSNISVNEKENAIIDLITNNTIPHVTDSGNLEDNGQGTDIQQTNEIQEIIEFQTPDIQQTTETQQTAHADIDTNVPLINCADQEISFKPNTPGTPVQDESDFQAAKTNDNPEENISSVPEEVISQIVEKEMPVPLISGDESERVVESISVIDNQLEMPPTPISVTDNQLDQVPVLSENEIVVDCQELSNTVEIWDSVSCDLDSSSSKEELSPEQPNSPHIDVSIPLENLTSSSKFLVGAISKQNRSTTENCKLSDGLSPPHLIQFNSVKTGNASMESDSINHVFTQPDTEPIFEAVEKTKTSCSTGNQDLSEEDVQSDETLIYSCDEVEDTQLDDRKKKRITKKKMKMSKVVRKLRQELGDNKSFVTSDNQSSLKIRIRKRRRCEVLNSVDDKLLTTSDSEHEPEKITPVNIEVKEKPKAKERVLRKRGNRSISASSFLTAIKPNEVTPDYQHSVSCPNHETDVKKRKHSRSKHKRCPKNQNKVEDIRIDSDLDDLPIIHPPKRRRLQKLSVNGQMMQETIISSKLDSDRIRLELPLHNWLENKYRSKAELRCGDVEKSKKSDNEEDKTYKNNETQALSPSNQQDSQKQKDVEDHPESTQTPGMEPIDAVYETNKIQDEECDSMNLQIDEDNDTESAFTEAEESKNKESETNDVKGPPTPPPQNLTEVPQPKKLMELAASVVACLKNAATVTDQKLQERPTNSETTKPEEAKEARAPLNLSVKKNPSDCLDTSTRQKPKPKVQLVLPQKITTTSNHSKGASPNLLETTKIAVNSVIVSDANELPNAVENPQKIEENAKIKSHALDLCTTQTMVVVEAQSKDSTITTQTETTSHEVDIQQTSTAVSSEHLDSERFPAADRSSVPNTSELNTSDLDEAFHQQIIQLRELERLAKKKELEHAQLLARSRKTIENIMKMKLAKKRAEAMKISTDELPEKSVLPSLTSATSTNASITELKFEDTGDVFTKLSSSPTPPGVIETSLSSSTQSTSASIPATVNALDLSKSAPQNRKGIVAQISQALLKFPKKDAPLAQANLQPAHQNKKSSVPNLEAFSLPKDASALCPFRPRTSAITESPAGPAKTNVELPQEAHSQPPFQPAGSLIVPALDEANKQKQKDSNSNVYNYSGINRQNHPVISALMYRTSSQIISTQGPVKPVEMPVSTDRKRKGSKAQDIIDLTIESVERDRLVHMKNFNLSNTKREDRELTACRELTPLPPKRQKTDKILDPFDDTVSARQKEDAQRKLVPYSSHGFQNTVRPGLSVASNMPNPGFHQQRRFPAQTQNHHEMAKYQQSTAPQVVAPVPLHKTPQVPVSQRSSPLQPYPVRSLPVTSMQQVPVQYQQHAPPMYPLFQVVQNQDPVAQQQLEPGQIVRDKNHQAWTAHPPLIHHYPQQVPSHPMAPRQILPNQAMANQAMNIGKRRITPKEIPRLISDQQSVMGPHNPQQKQAQQHNLRVVPISEQNNLAYQTTQMYQNSQYRPPFSQTATPMMPEMMPVYRNQRLLHNQRLAPPGACIVCGKQSSFVCSGCRKVWYCSGLCQNENWQLHSRQCKPS